MAPTLATPRLLLRPRVPADLQACLDLDADTEVMRHVGGPWTDAAAHADRLRARLAQSYPTGLGYWSLVERADPGRFLGWVALVPHPEDPGCTEIGWRLRREAWGRGLATEAAAVLAHHAFGTLGLPRLVATIAPGNLRSVRVARKLGMRLAGEGRYQGEPCLCFVLARGDGAS